MLWTIEFFPKCAYHVFLSHCAEDRTELVHPLHRALTGAEIATWLDRHEYPYGRGSRATLRDAIVECRHVVFLVTDAVLTTARGWCVQELAWAELLQDNLIKSGGPALQNVILPLFFVDPADSRLPRSVWQAVRDKGNFCPAGTDRVTWAVNQIQAFLDREQKLAEAFRIYSLKSADFRKHLRGRSGLVDRVVHFHPHPLSAPA
ncbi:toll/interleukin-1 receptor domain-containing protein [Fimbriiglobus ruber]|uniref:toll/interleukin-1 receptor domain-containing protein n=1 Tax=Fimbriiglobus ruber TaxID=1908690 RepID=UPI000B4BDC7F|nr:toll/interleukin-1 receptor domain-containing protein [Fimbriiglobus ruber]